MWCGEVWCGVNHSGVQSWESLQGTIFHWWGLWDVACLRVPQCSVPILSPYDGWIWREGLLDCPQWFCDCNNYRSTSCRGNEWILSPHVPHHKATPNNHSTLVVLDLRKLLFKTQRWTLDTIIHQAAGTDDKYLTRNQPARYRSSSIKMQNSYLG